MGGGFSGLALTSLLSGSGFFPQKSLGADGPLVPRPSHFKTKAKSCIFLMMNGDPVRSTLSIISLSYGSMLVNLYLKIKDTLILGGGG